MMIEIKGIGLPNRGAELMLLAIQQQFHQKKIDVEFVVEPRGDYSTRTRYRLYQKSRFFSKRFNFGWPFSLLPRVVRSLLGIVNVSEIDLVIDASGFAYGDIWGEKLIYDRLGAEIDYFKRRGVKVILLPQAFGPFQNPKVAKLCKKIFSKADLLIARDQISRHHIEKLGQFNVKLYPDFTNLVQAVDTPQYEKLKNRPCIIPNFHMIKRGGAGENYTNILSAVASLLQKLGQDPYILIHEGIKDREIAHAVNALLPSSVEIVDPQDALMIKSIISRASLVVGSRFHGLVSALSCGVPVVAMGWSHKYQALLAEYRVPELLIDVDAEKISEVIVRIIQDKEFRSSIKNRILEEAEVQKVRSKEMWEEVFNCINSETQNPR